MVAGQILTREQAIWTELDLEQERVFKQLAGCSK
jgi:hypothetical protein